MGGRARRSESGQAAVETALVLPLLIVAILGIVQLTLAQQARLMLEYAAFSAARAGSVANADPEPMRTAATLALLPTFPSGSGGGALTSAERVAASLAEQLRADRAAAGPLGAPQIAVEALSPTLADFAGAEEFDFDAAGDGPEERRRTQLTVRVTYFFELRIPLANWLIFESWYAAKTGQRLFGGRIAGLPPPPTGPPPASGCDRAGEQMRRLGRAASHGRYFLPLVTTWTLRMQSNPFRRHARSGGPDC